MCTLCCRGQEQAWQWNAVRALRSACSQVLKTLVAKVVSSNFHKRAHFDKIQDALNKVLQASRQPLQPEICICAQSAAKHVKCGSLFQNESFAPTARVWAPFTASLPALAAALRHHAAFAVTCAPMPL